MKPLLILLAAVTLSTAALAEDKIDTSGVGNKIEAFRKDTKKSGDKTVAEAKGNTDKALKDKPADKKKAPPAKKK